MLAVCWNGCGSVRIPPDIIVITFFSLQAPLTIAMYNWTANEAILYNGIIQTIQAIVASSNYAILAFTPIGKLCVSPSVSRFYFSDGRKLALFGLTLFMIYHIANIPWPFYDGPLDYMKLGKGIIDKDVSYDVR